MPVIAMTREMGSKGKDIALGLAESLGIHIVHHNLLEHDVSGKLHKEESDVHRHLEGKTSLLQRWSFPGKSLTHLTASEVLDLAEQGNVIIRGWGSTQLLRPVSHVLCIRVCAPMNNRVDTMMNRLGMSDPRMAQNEIEINDRAHERVIKRMMPTDWQDPLLYDLVINTERVPVEEGVSLIKHMLELPSFQETGESRAVLRQLCLQSRIKVALDVNAVLPGDSAAINVEVDPDTLCVTVKGGVLRRATRDRVIKAVESIPGIPKVVNDIMLVKD